jgi:DNA repair protein RecN (Recombination protein N)
MSHYQELADELSALNASSDEAEALRAGVEQAQQDFMLAADKLSRARQKAAKQLQKAVTHYLQTLGMQGGEFAIEFEALTTESANANGIDRLTFMISANPGQPLQPLSKVASGGELSRMSLAIQVVTHNDSSIPCLIFDEVDVGIGGGTAEVVGNLLAELAARAQVLCVTHQAQVAAKGDQHFSVAKSSVASQTQTHIRLLTGADRTEEIARMIGGIEITDQTRKFAKEMLDS